MNSFAATIDKRLIDKMPVDAFCGRVIVVQHEREVPKAVDYLAQFPIIGFDTETRPSFKKGIRNDVALLQLATLECCFLIRLNYTGLTSQLVDLLANPAIKKIGLSIKDDFVPLRRRHCFIPRGFVDIQELAPKYNIQEKSLQKIYAILFGKKISKGQQLSNWENDFLSDAQKRYAATDAWACYKIFNELMKIDRKVIEK
ncbi:MAG: 3'-5' exonuclease domain-containing protein 2 [Bacteroidales bacterium]|jgi:ribonuclease D|nr:3'-5' exonuclease domain-containing protein 2 [Bacteroidales bacterium]